MNHFKLLPKNMMNSFYLSIFTSATMLCSIVACADPVPMQEESFLSSEFFSENDDALFDDDISFFDDEFEDEILALEEELKKDAEISDSPLLSSHAVAETPVINTETPFEAMPAEEIKIADIEPSLTTPSAIDPSPAIEFVATESQPITSEVIDGELLGTTHPETLSLDALDNAAVTNAEVTIESPALLNIITAADQIENSPIEIDLNQAFSGSPMIYTLLLCMSLFAVSVWLYHFLSLRKAGKISSTFMNNLRNKLNSNHYDDAISLCTHNKNLFGSMIVSGINARKHGRSVMVEAMNAEGKRASVHFWQRLGLLNDIAIIAPMLGLLGTVLGMFYAFYDLNRSIESISTLFDGLGISVGTTVAGLIVAILALMLHSIAKYRLVKVLANVEHEAQSLVTLIDDHMTEYK